MNEEERKKITNEYSFEEKTKLKQSMDVRKIELTLTETILEATREVLHVAHAASTLTLAADSLN